MRSDEILFGVTGQELIRHLSRLGNFLDDDVPWDTRQINVPLPPALSSWHLSFQLVIGALCLLCSVILFFYFCFDHYRTRSTIRNSPVRRQSLWTVDQINACLIPLAIAVAVVASYFVMR